MLSFLGSNYTMNWESGPDSILLLLHDKTSDGLNLEIYFPSNDLPDKAKEK